MSIQQLLEMVRTLDTMIEDLQASMQRGCTKEFTRQVESLSDAKNLLLLNIEQRGFTVLHEHGDFQAFR